jgi:hypothetical protein
MSCVGACPTGALSARLLLDESARRTVPLKEAEIFHCVRCAKPMGAKPLIEAMFARLANHSMFAGEAERRRLQMCGDCRVIDLIESENGLKAWDMRE